MKKFVKGVKLTVPIIYILLWFEYNYHHALGLSKSPSVVN